MTPASKPVEEQSVLHAKLRTLDSVCDRFEREWQAGGEPSLEQYLSTVALEWRAELLAELLQLDIAYRRSRQQAVTPEQYVLLLPEHSESVRRIFHELQSIHDTQSGLETQSTSTSTNSAVERHSDRLGTGEPPEAVATPPAIVPENAAPISDVHAASGRTEDRPHPGGPQAKTNIPSRDEFERTLKASGVIDDEEWTRLAAEAPAIAQAKDAAELARALVRQGALTKFQATLLYQGKSALRMGEYVVLDQIGAGGMGQVFKARHRRMDRVVALKVLAKSAMSSPEAVKRFQREVKAAAKLSHPNIVHAYDAGDQDGVHYLVMEYVPGSDLSNLVKQQGPLPVAQSVRYILQAARGLAFAHSKGVIHRDVKPANLLVDAEGVVKILDMGLARLELEGADAGAGHGLTQTGQVMGTIDYMAPEQAFDTSKADAKADMYSLGCTLYRLLTGENMFAGDTLVQKILAHREMSIPSLRAARSEVSPQLDGLFQRMVAKQPENRPTMNELVAELEQLERGETTTNFVPTNITKDSNSDSLFAIQTIDTSPKAGPKPLVGNRTIAPKTAGRGKQPPTKKLLIGAAAAGAAALLFWGILVQFKDDKGNVIAEANVPGAVSVEVVSTPPKSSVAHAPNSPAVPAPSFLTATSTPSSPVSSSPGDYALSFGDGSFVEVASLGEALDMVGPMTFEAWVTPADEDVHGTQPVAGVGKGWLGLYLSFNRWDFRGYWVKPPTEKGSWYTGASGGRGKDRGRRTHVAGVRTDKQFHVFVDGVLRGSQDVPAQPLKRQGDPITIGGRDPDNRFFHGLIDEVRVSKVARYDKDFTPQSQFDNDDKTTALYHFDESAGDVLHDASGNKHDGKIVGAKWVKADSSAIPPAADWQPLFDGRSLTGWRGITDDALPADWKVEEDAIVAPGSKTSIATVAEYGDFELELEWKVQPGGNGGVFYVWHGIHLPSAADGLLLSAPEYQLVDNVGHPNGKKPETSAGSVYGLYAPSEVSTKSAGQWNQTRIVVSGSDVEHWLNGKRVVTYTLGSDDWKQRIAKHPRFAKEPQYGLPGPGRIALQSNTALTYYRNIRLRQLGHRVVPLVGAVPVGPTPPLAKAPFDAAQAKAHQDAWAKHLGTQVETVNSVGAKMILIPPGDFLMGSTDEQVEAALKVAEKSDLHESKRDGIDQAERPQHKVVITKPFLMSATEVTVGQFKKFAAATGYQTEAEKASKETKTGTYLLAASDDLPAPHITWNDATAYCRWLSTQEKSTYRLPTEAEWEYACRAGTTTPFSFGDDYNELSKYGWHVKNAGGKLHPVGMLLPNPFGLFDMNGNVYEWCGDYYNQKWYSTSPPNDPIGPSVGTTRVIRGAYWSSKAFSCRSACRTGSGPSSYRYEGSGFRIVRTLDAPMTTAVSTSVPKPTPTGPQPPSAIAPFDAAQAKAHQAAWAKHLGTTVETTNSVGAKMVLIPPGEFLMGSSDEQIAAALKEAEEIKADSRVISQIGKAERPQHKIVISKPLLMSATEVTIGQFKKFAAATGYQTEAEKAAKDAKTATYLSAVSDALPASFITWNDATAYCQWLSTQEKITYRLPTEAEWEYACRAGTTTQYSFGDDMALLDQYGWYTKNYGSGAHSVGTVLPNNFGLFDMHGSLAEWCGDYYDEKRYEKTPLNDLNGPSAGSTRVMRGGYWGSIASQCRCAYRYYSVPSFRHHAHGFRVVRTLDAPAATASVTPQPALPVIAQPPVAKPAGPSPAPAVAPFDAAQAKAHQEAWAKHLGTTVETTNSAGAKMVLIPPGEFLMGSTDEQIAAALKEADEIKVDQPTKDRIQKTERPQHKVVITKPLLMSATEVTVGQFKKFSATGYQTEAEKEAKDVKTGTYLAAASDDLPAAFITWNDATAYCQWLSTQEKTTYRLPTEAEWEYACRAGTTTQYSFGDDVALLGQYGWSRENAGGKSHPVGTKLPNGFGLFDMHGNLYEWCGDYFDEKWYSTSPPNDPNGPAAGSFRVIRGGYWTYLASYCRSAARNNNPPSYRISGNGFRIVRELAVPATTANVAPQASPLIAQPPVAKPAGPSPTPLAKAPFDAAQAKAHQAAWAQHLGTTVETVNSVGAKMILIPPGEFLMGSSDEQIAAALKAADEIKDELTTEDRIRKAERPQHRVVIAKPLLMGATEVTIGQFKKFTASGYRTEEEIRAAQDRKFGIYLNPSYAVTDDSPASVITWKDAVAYCRWLSEQENAKYRLPTEAEWEYACRAGTTTQYSFGDDYAQLDQYGWYEKNSAGLSHAVGGKRPNGFGLHDMHGNVLEFCQDFYDERWYEKAPSNDPSGPAISDFRLLRGGNWPNSATVCRSAYRSACSLSYRTNYIGFRVVRELDAPATTALATTSTPPTVVPPPATKPTGPVPPLAKAPFDAAQAKAHQAAWAKHLGTTVETTNSVGARMVLIPPGEFLMGSTDEQVQAALKEAEEIKADQHSKDRLQLGERPQHQVTITKPLLLGATEVTVGQFKKFAAATGYQTDVEKAAPPQAPPYLNPGYDVTDDSPAAAITWNDAVAYCQWLSDQEKTTYRLPTEAEWEYACRAGTTTRYSFGDDAALLPQYGWQGQSGRQSHAVGTKLPNGFGLFDMHGNVREWCGDFYVENGYGAAPQSDPTGPAAPSARNGRVMRGGHIFEFWCHSAYHSGDTATNRRNYNGFRVVRTLDAPATTASVTSQPVVPAAVDAMITDFNAPEFLAWIKQVQSLPAQAQVAAVAKKLMELNPGFDGKFTSRIENDYVTEIYLRGNTVTNISPLVAWQNTPLAFLAISHTKVSDLSPIQGLKLTRFECVATKVLTLSPLQNMPLKELFCQQTLVSDLSPLQRMKLTALNCEFTKVSDLSPLQGMPLTNLRCGCPNISDLSPLQGMPLKSLDIAYTLVSDLSPLKGMPLTHLNFQSTKVSDLSPLKGMPLAGLFIYGTQVSDLSPIKDLPLKELGLDFKPERDAELLRSIKSLEKINAKSAAEFWNEVEKK